LNFCFELIFFFSSLFFLLFLLLLFVILSQKQHRSLFCRGKLGLQITFAENAKVETQTLVFETDEVRKSWLDEIKKCIQLCGPIKLSDRQIQQSSSKVTLSPHEAAR